MQAVYSLSKSIQNLQLSGQHQWTETLFMTKKCSQMCTVYTCLAHTHTHTHIQHTRRGHKGYPHRPPRVNFFSFFSLVVLAISWRFDVVTRRKDNFNVDRRARMVSVERMKVRRNLMQCWLDEEQRQKAKIISFADFHRDNFVKRFRAFTHIHSCHIQHSSLLSMLGRKLICILREELNIEKNWNEISTIVTKIWEQKIF